MCQTDDHVLVDTPKASDIDFTFWCTGPDGRPARSEPEDADAVTIITDGEQAGRSFVESFVALWGRKVQGERCGPAWRLVG